MADLSRYLDSAAVAERIGVAGRRVIIEYLSRGDMPEPDLVWLNHPLWLIETIDEWQRFKGKHGKNRPAHLRRGRRSERVRTATLLLELPAPKPPSAGASRKRKRASSAPVSLRGAPSVEKAKLVARALRDEGHHCTVDDVRELAVTHGELPHERDVLRARVRRKLKEVKLPSRS